MKSPASDRLDTMPTLADLASRPDLVADVAPEQARAYLAQLVPLQTALLGRAFAHDGRDGSRGDRLLKIAEAADRLGQTVAYLYKHANALPFTVHNGRALRFSEAGIYEYIRARRAQPRP